MVAMIMRAVERPFCVLYFCQLLSNPSIDLKLEYIFGKSVKRGCQRYIVCMEILSTVPIGYNGMPQIHPQNCPFPFDDHHQNLIHPLLNRPLSLPKRHLDPISRFATAHFCGQTDLPTDRWSRRMFCTMRAPLAMLIENDALINEHLTTKNTVSI